jgi:anti-sigma B factor antagonist
MMLREGIGVAGFEAREREGILWLSGELDMRETEVFATAAARVLLETDGDVVLDLSDLEFIDSSGIRAMLALDTQDRRLVLRRPSPRVRKVLDLTGIVGRQGIAMED